jgi:AcrR family transcriptional regulator
MVEQKDLDTEARIKEAARVIFQQKGYAATRSRDIAQAAGINVALLNYYFRSKEKLFQLIMSEALAAFVQRIQSVLNDPDSTLDEKVNVLVNRYIDMLTLEPELPVFIISEIRSNPQLLLEKMPIREIIFQSVFARQLQVAIEKREIAPINPLHFFMNLIGLIIMPVLARPMLISAGNLSQDDFKALMEERRKYIPFWIKAFCKTDIPQIKY